MVLEPTSPFRSVTTFKKLVDIINTAQIVDSIITCKISKQVLWTADNQGYFRKVFESEQSANRQGRTSFYIESNSYFAIRWGYLINNLHTIGGNVLAVEVSEQESIDINYLEDLQIARLFALHRTFLENSDVYQK